MRHLHRRILENIISLFLSFLNIESRKVVFRTQWFIGQYCSEREGRGYRCRCTSVPLSLYFISILWRLVMTAFHRRPKKRRFFPFPNNHRFFFFVFLQHISSLFFYFYYTAKHFLTFSMPNRSRKPPFFMSVSDNSTLRYECDETFSDECEFAARAEGEWCNHTCQENVFRTNIVRNFISRGFRTRSVRKTAFTHTKWYKRIFDRIFRLFVPGVDSCFVENKVFEKKFEAITIFFHFSWRITTCYL